MPIGIDKQLEVAPDGTVLTATTLLPGGGNTTAWDQSTATRHAEFGLDYGLAVFPTAVFFNVNETYEFQIIGDTNKNLTTAPVVLADSQVLNGNDARITNPFFLPLPLINPDLEFVGAKLLVAGGAPSITFGARFMLRKDFQQYAPQPQNYQP